MVEGKYLIFMIEPPGNLQFDVSRLLKAISTHFLSLDKVSSYLGDSSAKKAKRGEATITQSLQWYAGSRRRKVPDVWFAGSLR